MYNMYIGVFSVGHKDFFTNLVVFETKKVGNRRTISDYIISTYSQARSQGGRAKVHSPPP